MEDYKGLKIPAKVIIVEKPLEVGSWRRDRENPQGYVVPAGDKNAIESAMNWARGYSYHYDENGHYQRDEEIPGIPHEYENGHFKLTVLKGAEGSWSMSGKLSFWTCTIACPDGKQFEIGISSDYLCETIRHNTLINGEVQCDVWLGKVKGNTMAVSKHQPSFSQAMRDETKRNTSQSQKYDVGDVVKTLTMTEVFCGTWYQQYSIERTDSGMFRSYYWSGNTYAMEFTVKRFTKPKPVYVYRAYHEEPPVWPDRGVELRATKPKRIITAIKDLETPKDLYKTVMDAMLKRAADKDFKDYYYLRTDDYAPDEGLYPSMYTETAEGKVDGEEILQILVNHTKTLYPYTKVSSITLKVVDENGNKIGDYKAIL